MKHSASADVIARLTALTLYAALLLLLAGCCHCRNASCDPGVQTPAAMNPMMKEVAAWLRGRKLSYSTNEVNGEASFRVIFAPKSGGEVACICTIDSHPERQLLTMSSAFTPLMKPEMFAPVIFWVETMNATSSWGFYTIQFEEQQLAFRISLFTTDQHTKPEELDRLLDETLAASRRAYEFLGSETEVETPATEEFSPTAEEQDLPPNVHLIGDKRKASVRSHRNTKTTGFNNLDSQRWH